MYVITNREVLDNKTGLDQFGKRPNRKGPNELRLAEVTRKGGGWHVKFLEDELPKSESAKLIRDNRLPLDPKARHFASLKVACGLADKARSRKRHILFFVHGYNNDMQDVIEQAYSLQRRYNLIVVPFSWPANGGGISGTASYKSDKRDARASTGALERAIQKVHDYLRGLTEARRQELWEKAGDKHPNNHQAREELYTALLDKDCPFTLNAMFHSMGNYLLKQMLKSSISEGTGLTFDNVLLVAADTNNLDHENWVPQIQFRKRCFVTINENDYALAASRAKSGSEQKARLGHFLRNLNANNAHYVNFTDASWVRKSHSYFNEPAQKNARVREFFQRAFTGESAEDSLRFHSEGNWYGVG
ncbi:MAG: alpha/beta hydrolase [Woeseiaceae bacterium]|nr:alpha/beta hydrolase [Woeseiaceae bacterium]